MPSLESSRHSGPIAVQKRMGSGVGRQSFGTPLRSTPLMIRSGILKTGVSTSKCAGCVIKIWLLGVCFPKTKALEAVRSIASEMEYWPLNLRGNSLPHLYFHGL